MEHVESIDAINEGDHNISRAQFGDKFAALRKEAAERAAQYRLRLQRAADASTSSNIPTDLSHSEPRPLRADPRGRDLSQKSFSPVGVSKTEEPEQIELPVRADVDLIALWSVVGPSTITAVFAGLAMSSSSVPLPYAIAFIFAWFALTSGLAVGVLKLFNTEKCSTLLCASAPLLGMAVISCALVAVLAVEGARLSITAIAAPAPQQVGSTPSTITPPVLTAMAEKVSIPTTARGQHTVNAQSVHFPSTPSVIPTAGKLSKPAVSKDEKVISLPKPVPQTSLQLKETVAATVTRSPRNKNDRLLGRISAKGKFLTHRGSSRWSGGVRKTVAKRRAAAPDTRNILEKIFNPVINSANAKAPARRIGTSSEELSAFSR